MTACDICEMIKQKSSFKLVYEDIELIAFLHEAPAFLGHTLLAAKNHHRIIEEVPDEIVKKSFNVANVISSAIFESLNAAGTNILVNNGVEAGQSHPHFSINIIPRNEDDGINLEWQPSQADPKKLEETFSLLKGFVDKAVSGTQEVKTMNMDEKIIKSDDDDYMIKQLRRIP